MFRQIGQSYSALTYSGPNFSSDQLGFARLMRAAYRLFLILSDLPRHQDVHRCIQLPGMHAFRAQQPQLPFKYLRQRYLARNLTLVQRSSLLTFHYKYMSVYLPPDALGLIATGGVVLWKSDATAKPHEIRLRFPDKVDTEGELGLDYVYDDRVVQCLSFTFGPAPMFGYPEPAVAIISRVQAIDDDPTTLRDAAKDVCGIAPRYALAAALQGVLLALRHHRVLAVNVVNQVTFERRPGSFSSGSYDAFFESLEGVARTDGWYELSIPFQERDLSNLSAQHRKRAQKRRSKRESIAQQSAAATSTLINCANDPA